MNVESGSTCFSPQPWNMRVTRIEKEKKRKEDTLARAVSSFMPLLGLENRKWVTPMWQGRDGSVDAPYSTTATSLGQGTPTFWLQWSRATPCRGSSQSMQGQWKLASLFISLSPNVTLGSILSITKESRKDAPSLSSFPLLFICCPKRVCRCRTVSGRNG